jgi:hypothetical protein
MPQLVIRFEWGRDPKGYRLLATGGQLRVVRNGKGHSPKDLEPCQPLSLTDSLFRIFANTCTTPDRVLDFVQNYGPLTWDGWDAAKGDIVRLVMHHADHMRQLFGRSAGKIKRPDLSGPFTMGVSSYLEAAVVWDSVMRTAKWELRPNTLLDALWLQLGQALTVGAQIRQCEHCGIWFEAGRGTGRRAGAKFCCPEHKIAFHSLMRSKEK